MLVLTRKVEQKIRIGGGITVTILRIRGRAVKIGIQAPDGLEILREELVETAPSPESTDSPPPSRVEPMADSAGREAPLPTPGRHSALGRAQRPWKAVAGTAANPRSPLAVI